MNRSIAKVVGIFIVVCLIACQSNSAKPQQENAAQNKIAIEDSSKNIQAAVLDSSKGVDVALTFLDDYIRHCNEIKKPEVMEQGTDEWIESNPLVTKKFLYAWQTILNNSYKEDAEIDPGFDPIFDAQDYPDEGFELESFNPVTAYCILRGKKWKEFRLVMKIINENGKWLVDGCGSVNVPYKYRIKR